MDRALWLLLRLRLGGYLRRWGRSLRTVKGLLLTLVGSLLFVPMVIVSLFAPRVQLDAQLALLRRYGALGLLGFCLLNLLLSSDERAIYFSPAEVEFLFSGPFRRRQLLIYRMVGGLFSSLLSALLMTFVFAHHATAYLPALVGLFLMIELMLLIAMAFGLFISTVGALAFNRRRKLVLAAVAVVLGIALVPRGREVSAATGAELLGRLEHSTILRVVSWPFRPPIMAFTAERVWPDLVAWTLLGLVVLAALAATILALDAEYYEATAAASARIYSARQRGARSGRGGGSRPIRTPITVPMLPWWGGVGPALWRQLNSAARHPDRFVVLVVFYLSPLLPLLLIQGARAAATIDIRFGVAMMAYLSTLVASLIVGFDFRSDIDRMDTLKALPLAPSALVVGELAVPVLMLTAAQAVCLVLAALMRGDPAYLVDFLVFLPPFNALLVEVESVLFLWYPLRMLPGSMMDFSAMGRQFLLLFAKLLAIGLTAGVAIGLGALVYHFVTASWMLALAVAWLVMLGFAAALIPLVVSAFLQFDVARDCPP
jgi:hypothetical protein